MDLLTLTIFFLEISRTHTSKKRNRTRSVFAFQYFFFLSLIISSVATSQCIVIDRTRSFRESAPGRPPSTHDDDTGDRRAATACVPTAATRRAHMTARHRPGGTLRVINIGYYCRYYTPRLVRAPYRGRNKRLTARPRPRTYTRTHAIIILYRPLNVIN